MTLEDQGLAKQVADAYAAGASQRKVSEQFGIYPQLVREAPPRFYSRLTKEDAVEAVRFYLSYCEEAVEQPTSSN